MTFNQLILIAYRICRGINFVRPTNDVASNFHVIGGSAVSHSERILTVISYYKHRSREYLDNLMAALVPIADHLLVVINDDEARTANFLVEDERLIVLSRPNIGMNIGIVPVVGISLPFISYGGSSTLAHFILIGIVQNIIVRSEK